MGYRSTLIAAVLGVGVVLALAGEAWAGGRCYRGSHGGRYYSSRSCGGHHYSRSGSYGRSYGHSYRSRPSYAHSSCGSYRRYSRGHGHSRHYGSHRYRSYRHHSPSRSYYRGSGGISASIGPVRVVIVPSRSYSYSRYGYSRCR